MPTISDIAAFLEVFAPHELAEEWDNVGLLLGDARRDAQRVMTCLTVTPESVAEAVDENADLVVSHHPVLFRPTQRITHETSEGRMLLQLLERRIAVYSPHTAFDSAAQGINQQLAERLQLREIQPLTPHASGLGAGRFGFWSEPRSIAELILQLKQSLQISQIQAVIPEHRPLDERWVRRVAVACGSAGSFLQPARLQQCDAFITGETSFHSCLDAKAQGMTLLLTGHYASERFAVETLASVLAAEFSTLHVWPSRRETDPLTSH